ncbi:hypothetical protein NPIL_583141 [Nephila pilipes]|uniref:Uncharacterized protein n=1 Tax=Nephila pilipes TaxID=299642 RepID=A0A8X6T6N5_NEPPI|nr:hypothetical protein NPIL_583141 [Nephila pilipes]
MLLLSCILMPYCTYIYILLSCSSVLCALTTADGILRTRLGATPISLPQELCQEAVYRLEACFLRSAVPCGVIFFSRAVLLVAPSGRLCLLDSFFCFDVPSSGLKLKIFLKTKILCVQVFLLILDVSVDEIVLRS